MVAISMFSNCYFETIELNAYSCNTVIYIIKIVHEIILV